MPRTNTSIPPEDIPTLLRQVRRSRGLSLQRVASEVGTGKGNLRRVENGDQVPKRELARALFQFYDGAVPLGAIYDPRYEPRPPRSSSPKPRKQ